MTMDARLRDAEKWIADRKARDEAEEKAEKEAKKAEKKAQDEAKKERKKAEKEAQKAEKAAAEREAKLEEAADFNFSPEDELSVQAKIAAAAKLFDKNSSTIALDGFDAKFLKPGHFKDNLRLALGIQLTRKELGALVKMYEFGDGSTSTGTGLVDCRNFMTAFLRMGVDMRREDHVKQLAKARQDQQKVKEQQEKILVALDQKDDVEIDYNFSEKDRVYNTNTHRLL